MATVPRVLETLNSFSTEAKGMMPVGLEPSKVNPPPWITNPELSAFRALRWIKELVYLPLSI
jgi:hypothetical protein